MSATISTNLDDTIAERAREIALRVLTRELSRELSALAARARFDMAAGELVAEEQFSNEASDADDIELLETATKVTRAELSHRD
jgi:hypothetical protein